MAICFPWGRPALARINWPRSPAVASVTGLDERLGQTLAITPRPHIETEVRAPKTGPTALQPLDQRESLSTEMSRSVGSTPEHTTPLILVKVSHQKHRFQRKATIRRHCLCPKFPELKAVFVPRESDPRAQKVAGPGFIALEYLLGGRRVSVSTAYTP